MSGAGVITGGWEFVAAAYTVTAVVLIGYALSIQGRYQAERARRRREADRGAGGVS
ncbi:MAG: hypothetical protein ABI968_04640 [Acidobacteriota bacterium]